MITAKYYFIKISTPVNTNKLSYAATKLRSGATLKHPSERAREHESKARINREEAAFSPRLRYLRVYPLFPALPEDGPVIKAEPLANGKYRYQVGDIVRFNCSSAKSKPSAILSWFINGEPVSTATPDAWHPPRSRTATPNVFSKLSEA